MQSFAQPLKNTLYFPEQRSLEQETIEAAVAQRRTFCLISHPDAGKTTVTEKLLLFGGAIQFAGTVKSRKSKKYATSDWMEIEKQRGISVTSSVMRFQYQNYEINLLDTPGHQDFLEETYRSITAVDSALMIIDAAKGIEAQTLKLWEVCQKQKIPVMAFINKMDREGLPPLELMEKIEQALLSPTTAISWPIGQGKEFKGIVDRKAGQIRLFAKASNNHTLDNPVVFPVDSDLAKQHLGQYHWQTLQEELELLDVAGQEFDAKEYLRGKQVPVFFGSAINNFGLQELLHYYLSISPAPQPRVTRSRVVQPLEAVSGFVFKIQANMDPNHRDRIAFVRICSGRFVRGMKLYHTRLKREMKIVNPIFFMAKERANVEAAYAGDIIGLFDLGNYRLGDSFSLGENLQYVDLPNFAPENFCSVRLLSTMKYKQLEKGLGQLSEEGSVQIFRKLDLPHYVVGVVGRLQFEVMKFRLKFEYGVDLEFNPLPYQCARWVDFADDREKENFLMENADQVFFDLQNRTILLATSQWELEYVMKKYPKAIYKDSQELQ